MTFPVLSKPEFRHWLRPGLALLLALIAAWLGWSQWRARQADLGLVSGNGRIEATEVDVATRVAGRLDALLAHEGDFVAAGQVLARMEVAGLNAQRAEAQARQQQAVQSVAAAQAQVAQRESDRLAVLAQVAQRESDLDAARRRLARSEVLRREDAASAQELDDDRARVRGLEAVLRATQAQVQAAQAALVAARVQVASAESAVKAAEATVARIEVDLADNELKAPRAGRVQFVVAQPGEVLAGGGKVLNLLDLGDVYMTFFLPETVAGRIALGAEVRIVLDAAPDFVVPARVSFVASAAQFTPKTVETASERQKLMFRVKARVDPELLRQHLEQVKTGLPGVAWLRIDPNRPWPQRLQTRAAP